MRQQFQTIDLNVVRQTPLSTASQSSIPSMRRSKCLKTVQTTLGTVKREVSISVTTQKVSPTGFGHYVMRRSTSKGLSSSLSFGERMGSWRVDGNHEDGVVDDHGDDDDDCPNVIGSLTMKRFASLMPKILRALAMVTPYFPTLLVVDDLHWAAAESLDLYRYIMSETPHPLSPQPETLRRRSNRECINYSPTTWYSTQSLRS